MAKPRLPLALIQDKMKNKVLILLTATFFLVSCDQESSVPSTSDNPNTSVTPTPTPEAKKENVTAQEAFSMLKKLSKASNYEIASAIKTTGEYHEWLTKGYYYNTSLGYGYLLKESFDKQYGDSIVYSFTLEDDEVKLSGPKYSYPNGKLTYVNDLSSLYVFPAYETDYKNKIDVSSFITESNGVTYSENRYVVKLFSASIGYTDDESLKQILRVSFYKQGTSFGFNLMGKTGEKYTNLYGTQTLISNIGQATHPTLDKYVAEHYSIGKTSLTSEVLSRFDLDNNERIKLHNEAHVYIDGTDQGVNLASELLLSKNKAEIITIDPETEATTSDIIARHEDGYAYEIGYDEKGKVTEKLYEKYLDWNDLVPDLKAKLLEEKECYRLENGEYVYYGRLANRLKDFFGQMDIKGVPERMYLTLDDNNQVNGARFEFALSKFDDGTTSFVYRYILNCQLEEESDFTVLTDLSDSLKIPELDNAFAAFDGSKPYEVSFQDTLATSPHQTITYVDGVYYKEETTTTFGGKKITANGYYQKDNGIQSFIMTEDGNYYPRSNSKEGDIASVSPHSISSALFEKKGDKTYVLRDHTLSYVSKGLPLNHNASLMFPETAKFNLGDDGLLSKVTFTYDWDIINSREEEVTFKYDDVSLPEGVKNTLLSLPNFEEPTSWANEEESIATNFESFYGEEAKNIPYLYTEETYKLWQSDYSVNDQIQLSNKTTSGIDANFYQMYRQALLKKGFKKAETPSLPGAEEYNLGKIKVRFAGILKGGFYFTLNNA